MNRRALVASVAAVFFAAGFLGGYGVGRVTESRRKPDGDSAMERLAKMLIEENERIRPIDAKHREDAEALHKAFMTKLGRDLKKLEDKPKGE